MMNLQGLDQYQVEGFYDEMFEPNGEVRSIYSKFKARLDEMGIDKLKLLQESTDRSQLSLGMTFNVYSDNQGVERVLHLDVIPRIISSEDWSFIEEGLKQRIQALNLFIDDVYNDQKIIKDKIIDLEMIQSGGAYLSQCRGIQPPHGIWSHISGTDIIRDKDGTYYVLEDNLRCPSGVSYMLENREIIKHIFANLFQDLNVRTVYNYSHHLRDMLESLTSVPTPMIAVMTPGIFNSAYFEHSYLAQQMGARLVEGKDLVVKNHFVYMITTQGLKRVDVIYRRVDDDFIDPLIFRKDSMLGTPGLFDAYQRGNVILVNAPGTGVADDKAVYTYIPKIVRYYLGEDIKLPNVPTYICSDSRDLSYVINNIDKLVVKMTNASGGYGMLIGTQSTKKQQQDFVERIKANPRNYIAQPTLSLSRVPTLTENGFKGRHVDLRPYVLYGKDIRIIPGALTRVALTKGSLVVNSSQGGGSKDTWVLGD